MSSRNEVEKPPLLPTREDRVATITINDAPLNRISLEFMDALQQVLQQVLEDLTADKSMGALVITGAGVLRCVAAAGREALTEGIAAARNAVLASMGTKHQRGGMRAFLEKRKPVFIGE